MSEFTCQGWRRVISIDNPVILFHIPKTNLGRLSDVESAWLMCAAIRVQINSCKRLDPTSSAHIVGCLTFPPLLVSFSSVWLETFGWEIKFTHTINTKSSCETKLKCTSAEKTFLLRGGKLFAPRMEEILMMKSYDVNFGAYTRRASFPFSSLEIAANKLDQRTVSVAPIM